ncbi:MAG: V-type proton ATPase subunit E [Gammaproteobacteria bacterium]|nr:V-type proton ATPase subunit E [Gammaproteobacteria bacterium]MBU1655238.1 V-type proton ATPase subunit E [Gammaproteobacteria bacterium]MBU1961333.1 V-type proton ATPase subunit E [Gammaproteobacteria bacterium]
MIRGDEEQVAALERAILDRARGLAEEYLGKATQQRDNILQDATERQRLAEEREVLAAKAAADRLQRRKVQAGELKIQAQLDQLRWGLALAVQSRLAERLAELRADRPAYRDWLAELLAEGARLIPEGDLIAEVDVDDLEWLPAAWPGLIAKAAPGRVIELSQRPFDGLRASPSACSGGILLRTADNRVRLDNRFEGRLKRLERGVQRVLMQHLFPHDTAIHPGGS